MSGALLVTSLARRAREATRALEAKQLRNFASFGWSKFDAETMSAASPAVCTNLVGGEWKDASSYLTLPDPMNGDPFIKCPDTGVDGAELDPFVASLSSVPKSGLHNPLKNPERYVELGEITARVVREMRDDGVMDHFARLIQRVCPKSYAQARGEVNVTRIFLENFCGDQPRWLARGFTNPGDHPGQQSTGYR
jgi:1-pyrroline-5-carboxylate dehydrogenase